MIRWRYAFIDRPEAQFVAAAGFWTSVTATALSPRRGDRGQFATLLPAGGADAYLKIQGVGGDGGYHLDLCVERVTAVAGQAQDLGATVVFEEEGLVVFTSPAGQPFCVVQWNGESGDATGHRVTIEAPPAQYQAEAAFWGALTGGQSHPVHIAIEQQEQAGPIRARLELSCADREAARAQHLACGATVLADTPQWTDLRDPVGGIYRLVSEVREGGP